MNATSQNIKRIPLPHTDADASIRDWVEALASGACESALFLKHIRTLGGQNSELIWEALSLLDQAFRSRRIERDTFLPIKVNLQQFALRRKEAPAVTIPKLSPLEPPAATRSAVAPVATPAPATAVAPASPEPIRIGSLLRGRYRIIGVLGKGSMGAMFEAIDEMRPDAPDIMQRIAIRVLDSRHLQESGQMSAYLRHVCKLQSLSHPNLLRVFDFDQDQGRPFLTMELLSGSSLPLLLAPTDAPLRYQLDRRHVLRGIAGALQCAHAQGMAHGELRAEEVFITRTGDVRLMGLHDAFNRTAADIPKDHLAFAWLVRDLLGNSANPEQLRRPEGISDKQWRALEAVILGNDAEGAKLLQLFAEPARAAAVEEIYTVSYTPPPVFPAAHNKARWLWSLLVLGVAGVGGYLAYDRYDLKSYFTSATGGAVKAAATGTVAAAPPVDAPEKVAEPAPAAAAGEAIQTPGVATPPVAAVSRVSTINFAQAALQVEDANTVARIRVQRQGNLASTATFVWWTESGSAEPGVDFFAVTPRGAHFPANSSSVDLFVPLVPAALHKVPVTFYVKIDEAGAGARLGGRTLAQVSIVQPGYIAPPATGKAATDP